jgi:hypothetical protein
MRATLLLSLQPHAHAGSSLADFSALKREAIRSYETSVHTRSTRRHIPEDGVLHSHGRENLRSYEPNYIWVRLQIVNSNLIILFAFDTFVRFWNLHRLISLSVVSLILKLLYLCHLFIFPAQNALLKCCSLLSYPM